MGKITRANVIVARAHRDLLKSRGKPVPGLVERIAALEFTGSTIADTHQAASFAAHTSTAAEQSDSDASPHAPERAPGSSHSSEPGGNRSTELSSTAKKSLDDDRMVQTPKGSEPVLVRRKTFPAARMTVEDAVDYMELVGHDFYFFVDKDTNYPSVVTKGQGWTYEVVAINRKVSEDAGRDLPRAGVSYRSSTSQLAESPATVTFH